MATETSDQLWDHHFNPWIEDGDVLNWLPEADWNSPLVWNQLAAKDKKRRRVRCDVDLFQRTDSPPADESASRAMYCRYRLWALIWCTPWLDWFLSTRFPEHILGPKSYIWSPGNTANAAGWVHAYAGAQESARYYSSPWPPGNLWLGVQVQDQADCFDPSAWPEYLRVRELSSELQDSGSREQNP